MTETYRVERGWRNGEKMNKDVLGAGLEFDDALSLCDEKGGYVVRESDGVVMAPHWEWKE